MYTEYNYWEGGFIYNYCPGNLPLTFVLFLEQLLWIILAEGTRFWKDTKTHKDPLHVLVLTPYNTKAHVLAFFSKITTSLIFVMRAGSFQLNDKKWLLKK